MIGTKFAKPLEPDTLTREVMHAVTREVQEQEPVYDENGRLIEYRAVTKTVTEDAPYQEKYDNPAPNTYTKYCEAVQWCNENDAIIVERDPNSVYPNGFYEVVTLAVVEAERLAKLSPEEIAAAELAQAKAERAAAVAAITVEIDGMVFDGDEKAQERMARAVSMADSLDEETEWVLHDSTVAIVTADQLRRACRAAGKAQTELWVKPYTNVAVNTEQHYTLE